MARIGWLSNYSSQRLEGNVVFGRLGLHASFGAGVPVFMLTCTHMFYTNVDMVPPAEIIFTVSFKRYKLNIVLMSNSVLCFLGLY